MILTKEAMFNISFFKTTEEKEKFLTVLGAIVARVISLKKGSELLGIDSSTLLNILDSMEINFTFLEEEDIEIEKQTL